MSAIHNPSRKVYKIILNKKLINNTDIIKKHKEKITYEEDKFFNRLFNSEIPHQGYAALIEKIERNQFKFFVKQELKIKNKNIIVVLDGINDPRNIGSIVRSCAAFNIDAILVNKKDFNSKSFLLYKSASGAMDKIPLFEVSNIFNELIFLKKENYFIFGMDSNCENSFHNFEILEKIVLIFGSEENGLKKTTKNICNQLFKIPIYNMESLNVSNACAATFAILNYLRK